VLHFGSYAQQVLLSADDGYLYGFDWCGSQHCIENKKGRGRY
jgi:hypothetical protein